MKDLKANESIDRRSFLRKSSLTGLGVASAAILAGEFGAFDRVPGASAVGLGSTKVKAAGPTATDIAVLQFALNLEYLEAEFYSYVVTGKSLEENGVAVTGIGTAGPTTNGYIVPFTRLAPTTAPLAAIAAQLMRDEVNHVKLLRTALGAEYTIAKPAINLGAMGTVDNLETFVAVARDFEVVGVSAYGGAVTLLSEAVLQVAAQIALVEGLHAGNLQLCCELGKVSVKPVDGLDMVPPPAGTNYFDDSLNQGLAIIRTPSEVLSIVYGSSVKGTKKGGFFPQGVNGSITTV